MLGSVKALKKIKIKCQLFVTVTEISEKNQLTHGKRPGERDGLFDRLLVCRHKDLSLISSTKQCMVVPICNPSTWKAETGGSFGLPCQPHSEF